jgi:hypothetical protein
VFLGIRLIKFKTTTPILAIAVLVLGPTSAVICHGSDGHVALESVFYNCCRCNDNDLNMEQAIPTSAIHGETHGHCTDFPLNIEWAVDRKDAPSSGPLDQLIINTADMGSTAGDSNHIDSLDLLTDIPCYPTRLCSVILRL